MARKIEVQVNESMHNRKPQTRTEEISWAALDTAYGLLRDTAVELTFQVMREQAATQGLEFPMTDEDLFAKAAASGDPEAPKNYADLAPDDERAAYSLHSALHILAEQALYDAQAGLDEARDETGL